MQTSVYPDVDDLAVKQLKSGVVNGWKKVDKTQTLRQIPRIDEVSTETKMNVECQGRIGLSVHRGYATSDSDFVPRALQLGSTSYSNGLKRAKNDFQGR